MPWLDDNSFAPVTAILDENGNQLFETVGILGLSAASAKQYPQHTLENGITISDHSYDLQDRVSVRCMLDPDDYVEVYRRIKRAFNERAAFIIQTKVETYTKMYLDTLPHEEDRKTTVTLALEFIQQRFQSPRIDELPVTEVENPSDADTQNAGDKRGQEVEKKTTLLNKWFGS